MSILGIMSMMIASVLFFFQTQSVAIVRDMDVKEHFLQFVRTSEDISVLHCFVFYYFFLFPLKK